MYNTRREASHIDWHPYSVDRHHSEASNDRCLIDTLSEASIDTCPRANNMVTPLILTWDVNGDLPDPEGHLCNGACRKIDDQGAVIPDPEADALQAVLEAKNTAANAHSAQPRTLAEYLLDNSWDRSCLTCCSRRSFMTIHIVKQQHSNEILDFVPHTTHTLTWTTSWTCCCLTIRIEYNLFNALRWQELP